MTTPAAFWLDSTETCPRCHSPANMNSIGTGLAWRCARCEWQWTASAAAYSAATPTAVTSGALSVGGTALTLATPAAPTIPLTGVAATNSNAYAITVVVAGGTMTGNTLVNGVSQGVADGTFIVPPASTITISYSSAPSWTLYSAGALFTSGMMILLDAGTSAEILKVGAGAALNNIPLAVVAAGGTTIGGLTKPHLTGAAVGVLVMTSALAVVGGAEVPNAPGWGF